MKQLLAFVGVRDWRFMCNKNVRLAPNQITRGRYTTHNLRLVKINQDCDCPFPKITQLTHHPFLDF